MWYLSNRLTYSFTIVNSNKNSIGTIESKYTIKFYINKNKICKACKLDNKLSIITYIAQNKNCNNNSIINKKNINIFLIKNVKKKITKLPNIRTVNFIIKAKLIKELKQYIDDYFLIDTVVVYHKLEKRISSDLVIKFNLELYRLNLIEQKEADSEYYTTFKELIPGNRYILKANAELEITKDFFIYDNEELELITRPISFTHDVTTVEPIDGDCKFLIKWEYPDDNINKDVDKHIILIFDKIPEETVWNYENSINKPEEINNKKETDAPIGIDSCKVNNDNRSKYILNPFKEDMLGEGAYRWIQLRELINYDKNNIKYKEEE